MNLELTKFLSALSVATDFVEAEVLTVPRHHEKRVAVLAHRMGEQAGLDGETLYALTQAAALHDCALDAYLQDELPEGGYVPDELNMARHCEAGERLLLKFPFYHRVKGAVLYHHDRADGKGAMGKTAAETPLSAQIIHLADKADVEFHLFEMDWEKPEAVRAYVRAGSGTLFSPEVADFFLAGVDNTVLESLTGDAVVSTLRGLLPDRWVDLPMEPLREMATVFAHVTDYKSHFTWQHSQGLAEKAERLGAYYGFPWETCDKLYIAGALHDIGKLLIPNSILEKPGRLTPEEYREITNHALGTWELLHGIGGLEDITRWAALHHEKLDGSGYPFGYTDRELGRMERLMACLDIYQALVEERPYKAGLSHGEAMAILRKMGAAGQLDKSIILDIEGCHDLHECCGVPMPPRPAPEPRVYAGPAWRCPVCGYIYEGELPGDFICPRCEQPASVFEKL